MDKILKFIWGINNLNIMAKSTIITIGSFDGMHKGHQCLIDNVVLLSQKKKLPSMVIIFEPQPKEYFSKNSTNSRIMTLRDKLIFLKKKKIDYILCIRFNLKFLKKSPEDFVNEILIQKMKCRYLIVGRDFQFGFKRKGNIDFLKKLKNFTIKIVKTQYINKKRISSSWLRECLLNSKFNLASKLLGRNYIITGKIFHGIKLGRKLGFPTININLSKKMVLSGIYYVQVQGIKKYKKIQGIASIGNRPMIKNNDLLLEVYLLDFKDQCYGKLVSVIFLQKIRDEKKFVSFKSMIHQMHIDLKYANYLKNFYIDI